MAFRELDQPYPIPETILPCLLRRYVGIGKHWQISVPLEYIIAHRKILWFFVARTVRYYAGFKGRDEGITHRKKETLKH